MPLYYREGQEPAPNYSYDEDPGFPWIEYVEPVVTEQADAPEDEDQS